MLFNTHTYPPTHTATLSVSFTACTCEQLGFQGFLLGSTVSSQGPDPPRQRGKTTRKVQFFKPMHAISFHPRQLCLSSVRLINVPQALREFWFPPGKPSQGRRGRAPNSTRHLEDLAPAPMTSSHPLLKRETPREALGGTEKEASQEKSSISFRLYHSHGFWGKNHLLSLSLHFLIYQVPFPSRPALHPALCNKVPTCKSRGSGSYQQPILSTLSHPPPDTSSVICFWNPQLQVSSLSSCPWLDRRTLQN